MENIQEILDSPQVAKDMYLDYLNNFLTVGAFADHYSLKLGIQLDDIEANTIIDLGRKLNQAKERKL